MSDTVALAAKDPIFFHVPADLPLQTYSAADFENLLSQADILKIQG